MLIELQWPYIFLSWLFSGKNAVLSQVCCFCWEHDMWDAEDSYMCVREKWCLLYLQFSNLRPTLHNDTKNLNFPTEWLLVPSCSIHANCRLLQECDAWICLAWYSWKPERPWTTTSSWTLENYILLILLPNWRRLRLHGNSQLKTILHNSKLCV